MSARTQRRWRSISTPIVLASTSVAVSITMLIGWIAVILQNRALSQQVIGSTWVLVAGILSLVFITFVLVLFGVFLVREILEGRRQITFIDSVTHELKSPLASLKLCLETLARGELQAAQRESLRAMMLDDVERLSAFIDDVLVASRLDDAKRVVMVSDLSANEVLQRCAEQVLRRHHLPATAITIDAPEGLLLTTDRSALEAVLRNLLDNACKYSREPVAVQARARADGNTIAFEVRDQGIGIPAAQLHRVFERFYRAPGEAVRSRRGTGLGLFVAASLVRTLGGQLEASSPGPDKGTRMHFSLPLGGSPSHSEIARDNHG